MIRILHQNSSDYATVTATNVAGGYYAASLQNNLKGQYLQTTGTSTVITATYVLNEIISCVALPKCNLTSAATLRVQFFSDGAGTVQIYDSGTQGGVVADKAIATANYAPIPTGAAGWAFGGGSYALLWPTPTSGVKCVKVTVTDSTLSSLQISRLVCGNYTELSRDVAEGVNISVLHQSTVRKNRAGDTAATILPQSKLLKFDMHLLTNSERRLLIDVINKNSVNYPFFISVLPTSSNLRDREDFCIFGFLQEASSVSITTFDTNAASISILEF